MGSRKMYVFLQNVTGHTLVEGYNNAINIDSYFRECELFAFKLLYTLIWKMVSKGHKIAEPKSNIAELVSKRGKAIFGKFLYHF